MYHSLKFAAVPALHLKINKSSVRTIAKKKKKKEIFEAMVAATPAGSKPLFFFRNTCLSHKENPALTWVQDSFKKGIPTDTSVIGEKVKPLFGNLRICLQGRSPGFNL